MRLLIADGSVADYHGQQVEEVQVVSAIEVPERQNALVGERGLDWEHADLPTYGRHNHEPGVYMVGQQQSHDSEGYRKQ